MRAARGPFTANGVGGAATKGRPAQLRKRRLADDRRATHALVSGVSLVSCHHASRVGPSAEARQKEEIRR
jgi:hypothetical protein